MDRGAIFSIDAYAQSKMLDHSAWQKGDTVLPRRITPSDIDVGFLAPDGSGFHLDNNGKIIFGELTRGFANWVNIRWGQRRFYEACIANTQHCAALCQHNVPPTRQICTRTDIIAFQIMIFDYDTIVCAPFLGNDNWQRFVFKWCNDPVKLRRYLIGRHVDMIVRPKT